MNEELNREVFIIHDKPIQQNGLTMPITNPSPIFQTPTEVPNTSGPETKQKR